MSVVLRWAHGSNMASSSERRKPRLRFRMLLMAVGTVALVFYLIGSWRLFNRVISFSSSTSSIDALGVTTTTATTSDYCRPPQTTNFGFLCEDPAVNLLQLSPPTASTHRAKILCLVLTQSTNHATRMQAVVDTWGRKCTILVGASNMTDPDLHTYRIESQRGYWGIWDKLLQAVRQVLDGSLVDKHHPNDFNFDWILKADDDTYVIMENLLSFLANVTIDDPKEPRIYGRTMAWPRLKRFQTMNGWFGDPLNRDFGKRFYSKLSADETLRFSHGGPGYIMNRAYAQRLVGAYFNNFNTTNNNDIDAVQGEVAEDIANAVTMLYHGIRPRSTFDLDTGKERMHPESPQTMYADPIWMERMHHGMKGSVHGPGEKCCSPTSISYHYVADFQMRLLDYQLYHCPRPS